MTLMTYVKYYVEKQDPSFDGRKCQSPMKESNLAGIHNEEVIVNMPAHRN
jgi:hypothetical protein